ncbi:LacI family DNA-binding transcriptional regulator [Cellulosilyticum ruminicola]|uniref:LacI family DNA-binding transcriptional regulator n=1 Tax=Cellulosilyticum ruminicola TaxID=425254 RepID=UPI000AF67943|nr:LacI family DNA-binding transcriptional regulator [Cellulosilyticum ruminicola]
MAERVTIQDIADALGLSRNTVSKAINNTGVLADSTREKILQKAIEMGYKQFSYLASLPSPEEVNKQIAKAPGEIALFTGNFIGNSHFASIMLDKFQKDISALGYSMTIHRISPENIETQTLPITFNPINTKGIMCIEMFDYNYCKILSDLNLPMLMVDGPVLTYARPLNADMLLMNNNTGIFELINDLQKKGLSKFGFVGEITHCRSFFERYTAFRDAMYLYSLPVVEEYSLKEASPNGMHYTEYLYNSVENMKELPEVFICANDFAAIDLLQALKKQGINCPDDILIVGFDDSPESIAYDAKTYNLSHS